MRIGVDLGGTKTEIIVLDATGRERYRERSPTPRDMCSPLVSTTT